MVRQENLSGGTQQEALGGAQGTVCVVVWMCGCFILDIYLLVCVQNAVDIFGLSAIDRLFCFMIVRELQNFLRYLQRGLMKTALYTKHLRAVVKELGDTARLIRME